MPKFRKKPVVIEAMQFAGRDSYDEMLKKWGDEFNKDSCFQQGQDFPDSCLPTAVAISTLEGMHWANKSDWIIKGTANEFYPCKDAIFKEIYEPVEEK